jgi:diadenosine tetraphosphate (Ap4A) HIT family hydrolase
MDIMPQSPGHVLVITRNTVDQFTDDLSAEAARAVMKTTHKIAPSIRKGHAGAEGFMIGAIKWLRSRTNRAAFPYAYCATHGRH